MTAIFLPLRSNASWLAGDNMRRALERQIKGSLLVYDEIVLQDGRYRSYYVEQGSFEEVLAPDTLGEKRKEIRYFVTGEPFRVEVATTADGDFVPVLEGNNLAAFEVDYFPILYEAGLLSAEYIRWRHVQLSPEGKQLIDDAVRADLTDPELLSLLPENPFFREKIVQSLYGDALLADELRLPLSFDQRVAPVAIWKNRRTAFAMAEVIRPQVHASLVDLTATVGFDFPDPLTWSWDRVHDVRESAAGRELRATVGRFCEQIVSLRPEPATEADVRELAGHRLIRELADEALERRLSVKQVALTLLLNLIPLPWVGGIFSAGMDLRALLEERRSWISLLRDRPS